MSRGPGWIAVGASFAFACSLVTSLDDLKRVDDAPCDACIDGGDAPSEASILDASGDVFSAVDATDSAAGDAAPDVRIDAAPPPPFCASLTPQPKLCADFDTGLFSAQFTSVQKTLGSTLMADSAAFRSPGNGLLASLPASASSGDRAYMSRDFTGTATTVSYAFDLRIDSWATDGKSGILAGIILDESLPTQHGLSFYVTNTKAALEEMFGTAPILFVDHALPAHPLLGEWNRMRFDIDITNHTCSASINGVPALTNSPLDASWAPGIPRAKLGIPYVGSQSSAWTARYDNVVIDWK